MVFDDLELFNRSAMSTANEQCLRKVRLGASMEVHQELGVPMKQKRILRRFVADRALVSLVSQVNYQRPTESSR